MGFSTNRNKLSSYSILGLVLTISFSSESYGQGYYSDSPYQIKSKSGMAGYVARMILENNGGFDQDRYDSMRKEIESQLNKKVVHSSSRSVQTVDLKVSISKDKTKSISVPYLTGLVERRNGEKKEAFYIPTGSDSTFRSYLSGNNSAKFEINQIGIKIQQNLQLRDTLIQEKSNKERDPNVIDQAIEDVDIALKERDFDYTKEYFAESSRQLLNELERIPSDDVSGIMRNHLVYSEYIKRNNLTPNRAYEEQLRLKLDAALSYDPILAAQGKGAKEGTINSANDLLKSLEGSAANIISKTGPRTKPGYQIGDKVYSVRFEGGKVTAVIDENGKTYQLRKGQTLAGPQDLAKLSSINEKFELAPDPSAPPTAIKDSGIPLSGFDKGTFDEIQESEMPDFKNNPLAFQLPDGSIFVAKDQYSAEKIQQRLIDWKNDGLVNRGIISGSSLLQPRGDYFVKRNGKFYKMNPSKGYSNIKFNDIGPAVAKESLRTREEDFQKATADDYRRNTARRFSRDYKNSDYNESRHLSKDVEKCRYSATIGDGEANCDTTEDVINGAKAFNRVGETVIGFGTQIVGRQAQQRAVESQSGAETYRQSAKLQKYTATARAVQGVGDLAMAYWQNKRKKRHIKSKKGTAGLSEQAYDGKFIRSQKKTNRPSYGDQQFQENYKEAGHTDAGTAKGEMGYVSADEGVRGGKMANRIINKFKLNEEKYYELPKGARATSCDSLPGDARVQCMQRIIERNQIYRKKKAAIQNDVSNIAGRASAEQKRFENKADTGMWTSIFRGVQNAAQSAFGFWGASELEKSAKALEQAERAYQDNVPDFSGDSLPDNPNQQRGFNFSNDQSEQQTALSDQITDGEDDPNLTLGDAPFDPYGDDSTVPETPTPGAFNPADSNQSGGGGGTQALGSGQTSPADPSAQESAQAQYAKELEDTKSNYIIGGAAAGYQGGGGGAGGGDDVDGGFDFSQFANLIPGLKDEESETEKNYRVSFGGDRNTAGIGGAYVHDRDSDLFEQVNNRYIKVKDQGRL